MFHQQEYRTVFSGNSEGQQATRSCLYIAFLCKWDTENKSLSFSDFVTYSQGSCLPLLPQELPKVDCLIKKLNIIWILWLEEFSLKVKQEDHVCVEVVLVKLLPVWSLGGTDWLQRRAGGRAAFLSGQQDTAGVQTSSSSTCCYCPRCRCCPLLDGDGGGSDVFVVEAFDAIVEVIHLHLLHLNKEKERKYSC